MESFEPGLNQKQFGDFKFGIVSLAPNVPYASYALHLRVFFPSLLLRVKYPVPLMPCSEAPMCVCAARRS